MYENVDDGGEKTVDDQNLNEFCFDFDSFVGAFVDKIVNNVEQVNKNYVFDGKNSDIEVKNINGLDVEK